MSSLNIIRNLLRGNCSALLITVTLLTVMSFIEASSLFFAAPVIYVLIQPELDGPNIITSTIFDLIHFSAALLRRNHNLQVW